MRNSWENPSSTEPNTVVVWDIWIFGLFSSCESDGAAKDVEDGIMDPLERQEVLATLGFRCLLTEHQIGTDLSSSGFASVIRFLPGTMSKHVSASSQQILSLGSFNFRTAYSLIIYVQPGKNPTCSNWHLFRHALNFSDMWHVSWMWGLDFDYVQPPLRRSTVWGFGVWLVLCSPSRNRVCVPCVRIC